jgi:hypothetical protein
LLLGWQEDVGLGGVLGLPGLAELVTDAVDGAVLSAEGIFGGSRVGSAMVQPVIRAQRSGTSLTDDKDAIRFTADYHADSVELHDFINIKCEDIDMHLEFELGFERIPGGISIAPGCHQQGDPGGFLQTNDGFTYDYTGVVYDVRVSVPQFCVLPIADAMSNGIRASIPGAFGSAIADASLVDPGLFGLKPVACTCDDDCNEFADGGAVYGYEGGRRPRCHFEGDPAEGEGQCWLQLEIDRLNVRPEGLEAVLMEDEEDRQLALVEGAGLDGLLCGADRLDALYGDPVMSSLPYPYSVP